MAKIPHIPVGGPAKDVKDNPLAYLRAAQKGKRAARRAAHVGHLKEMRRWTRKLSGMTSLTQ